MDSFKSVKSVSVPFDGGDIISKIKEFPYALLIKTDSVSLISTSDDFDAEKLIEVRAFNDSSEFHAILVNGNWRGRIRTDSDGNDVEVFDRKLLIWGKCVSSGTPSVLYEDRGITVNVPVVIPEGKRAFLLMRSYLSGEKFEFIDCRICSIGIEEANGNE